MKPCVVALTLGLGCCATMLTAQQRPDTARTRLPALEVRAVRDSVPATPGTQRVEPVLLRRTQASNPYDLLRRTADLEVRDQGQGPGFASNAILRGFTSDHSSDLLFSLDGVPLNLPLDGHVEGYADWSVLQAASLAGLDVTHGPTSLERGNFAFGGSVDARTPLDDSTTVAALGGSSFGDALGWVRGGRRGRNSGVFAAATGRRDDGWRDNSAATLGNVLVRGWQRMGRAEVDGGVVLYASRWRSPGFASQAQFDAGNATAAVDTSDGGTASRGIVHGRLRMPIRTGTLEVQLWGQRVRQRIFLNIPNEVLTRQTDEADNRLVGGGRVALRQVLGSVLWHSGIDARLDDGTYDNIRSDLRQPLLVQQAYDFRHLGVGAFTGFTIPVGSRVTISPGVRADRLHYATVDRVAANVRADATQWVLQPKLRADMQLNESLSLHGSAARGFRGAPGTLGDPTKPAITTWATDLGLHASLRRVALDLSIFRHDVRNESIQNPITRDISNAGASVRQGIELRSTWEARRWLSLGVAGTVNDARITAAADPLTAVDLSLPEGTTIAFHDDEALVAGGFVPGVASNFGRVWSEVRPASWLQLRGAVRWSGAFTPIGEPDVRTTAYAVGDIGLSVRLPGGLRILDLDLQNVTNAAFPEIRAAGFINPGAPRVLRATVRVGDGGF